MTPDDIHVELKEGVLTVSGEKKDEAERTEEREGVKTYRKERTFNKFTRSFVLPENTIPDEIAARVDNGVLTLDM
jgi:HSP20 family protein